MDVGEYLPVALPIASVNVPSVNPATNVSNDVFILSILVFKVSVSEVPSVFLPSLLLPVPRKLNACNPAKIGNASKPDNPTAVKDPDKLYNESDNALTLDIFG